MITFFLKIEVDQYADDSHYDLLFNRLKCISDQVFAEPLVDTVRVYREDAIREDDIC